MGLLDSEAGKRRLLTVEIPVIEQYNAGRDPEFRVAVTRAGGSVALRYRLMPGHNPYLLETRLLASYPTVPPETRVLTPLKHCPHLLEGQSLCLWRQGSTRAANRWDPAQFTCVFAVQAAWRWLACYEIWHETGSGPSPRRSERQQATRTAARRPALKDRPTETSTVNRAEDKNPRGRFASRGARFTGLVCLGRSFRPLPR